MKKRKPYVVPSTGLVLPAPWLADNTYGNNEGQVGLGSGPMNAGMGQAKQGWAFDEDDPATDDTSAWKFSWDETDTEH